MSAGKIISCRAVKKPTSVDFHVTDPVVGLFLTLILSPEHSAVAFLGWKERRSWRVQEDSPFKMMRLGVLQSLTDDTLRIIRQLYSQTSPVKISVYVEVSAWWLLNGCYGVKQQDHACSGVCLSLGLSVLYLLFSFSAGEVGLFLSALCVRW